MPGKRNRSLIWRGHVSRLLLISVLLILLWPTTSEAHVKWFSEGFSYNDKPLSLGEVLNSRFYLLAGLSVIVILVLTLLEEKILKIKWIAKIDEWFLNRSDHVDNVLRIGLGVTLLWCWQAGKLLAPELHAKSDWSIWLQLLVAILLVFPQTLRWAGFGVLVLYGVAIYQFGFFHMLDYLLFLGVGWYFIAFQAKNERIQISALPGLYAGLGFCLIWLGIEKLVYPSWSRYLLEQNPVLTLGLEPEFFVCAAALIEISLGFMIMVCLQERLLALSITLLFVLTTLVFGKVELVGHTIIHTILIVFLFAGPGKATPPLHWIPTLGPRIPATALAFILLVGTLMIPYTFGASIVFQRAQSGDHNKSLMEVPSTQAPPRLGIAMHKDSMAGWNLELLTENFQFTPAAAGLEPVPGEGHAHLHINGKKVARLYGPWYHIPNLPVGKHQISVSLHANNHKGLTVEGEPVRASAEIEVLSVPD